MSETDNRERLVMIEGTVRVHFSTQVTLGEEDYEYYLDLLDANERRAAREIHDTFVYPEDWLDADDIVIDHFEELPR